MGGALDTIACIVAGDETADYLSIPWHQLRYQHTAAIRSELAEHYAYSTANNMLSALRGVLKAAWKLGLMTAEEYQTAASVENIKGETVPAGRYVPLGEVTALLNTCEQTAAGIRDAAVITLLYAVGLRRAEVVALGLTDYDMTAGTLTVKGKRNKERLVPVVKGAAAALVDWLTVRGDTAGPLFTGAGNRNSGSRLTTQAIYKMLQTRAELASIGELSPHDLRRTYVGELLDRGADISTVQKLAGHANVTTTARYDRRGEAAKRKAAELLHMPCTRRILVGQHREETSLVYTGAIMTEEATDDDFRETLRDILGNLRWLNVTTEQEQYLVSLMRKIYQKALNNKEISSSLFEDLDLSTTQELRIKRVLAKESVTAVIRDHLQLANQLAYTYSQPMPPCVPAEIYDGKVHVANVMVDILDDLGILRPKDRADIIPLNKALVANQKTLTLRCSEGTFSIRAKDAEEASDDGDLDLTTWHVWLDKSIDN